MKKEIGELIEISRYYGTNRDYVIAGGGNTSYKDDKTIWIKASGYPLATLDETGLVALDRERLRVIAERTYSDDPVIREDQVRIDLMSSIIDPEGKKRPSVETSLHEIIRYSFVVHLHPAVINGILCSRHAKQLTYELFGEKALFVPYTDPGYTLFKSLEKEIIRFREKHMHDPGIIFLENHGVFVSADTTEEVRETYRAIISLSGERVQSIPEIKQLPSDPEIAGILPVMRMMLSEERVKVLRFRHNTLIAEYYKSRQEFHKISLPLTPDIIVYCKSRYLYIEQSETPHKILESFRQQLPRFIAEHGYMPKVIVVRDVGIISAENSVTAADAVLDIYEDLIRIRHYTAECGGPRFLTREQSDFIDKWEVENYRREVALSVKDRSKISGRIAIVTGGARGFGAGIAEHLFNHSANVVIADLNEKEGNDLADRLNEKKTANKAVFIKADVSDPESVRELVNTATGHFGGLDILISNAGVLRAGGLDEMDPAVFASTTGVNYNGYFHCAKYASEIMRLQNQERENYYTDIIQINSKSGLRGSNRNFAYAGSKFGGIGLTQSFALELAPHRIKVNSVCPGNFYEGPLWSDPANGLFIQYLKAGKVPGAKTIDDVRKFYEDQVPMKRGCRLEDVFKAILYIIDQEYETGQAVPVTGGQVMLG